MAFFLSSAPGVSFFARPYPFRNRILPVELVSDHSRGTVAFRHLGRERRPTYLCAELPKPNRHFDALTATRLEINLWESFVLRDVPTGAVSEHLQQSVALIEAVVPGDATLLSTYALFGDDALAAATAPSQLKYSSVADLVVRFESLGENCEFGFMQRYCGAEPLGLLRFGGGLKSHRLAEAIRNSFAGIGQVDRIRAKVHIHDDLEFLLDDDGIGLNFHTWRIKPTSIETVIAEEALKLRFLAKKLMEDFEDGEKIFVLASQYTLTEEGLSDIVSAIRKLGPGVVLSVVLSDLDHPPGTVVSLREGLLRGYIDEFSNEIWKPSLPAWIRICRNALAIVDR
jgi:hypothetical protein